ncbi:hypothetical protein BFP97_00680 [Roseivirga sp. 4D4]|uniref:DUF1295 domain-containing protein n=1 Tax=Roseivirga sp. 4D4 TaxID=1889784 RepID=UPI000852AED8|nr:DUF1295 domain-containing protein [Roseivirga sp. 4D4]OEK00118.1 hypothetical protein BFP97_00680 [Roseivirga sp. 4D4]
MIQVVLDLLLLGLAYASFWFIVSIIVKRNDIADVAWGLGYVGLCVYLYLTQMRSEVADLAYGVVIIWGLRLSIYIGLRNLKKKEDFRYKKWREEWGSNFYWRSYLQVYLLQVLLLLIISTPLIIVSQAYGSELNFLAGFGLALWLTGFYWQAVGDYQLARFKKKKTHKDQIIQSGLWEHSRHPNYFGEILMWFGVGLIVLNVSNGWTGLISPILITYLLLKVSGVPMLERRYKDNAAFQAYKKRTPAVFPNLWSR